jgi:hypothetical protein
MLNIRCLRIGESGLRMKGRNRGYIVEDGVGLCFRAMGAIGWVSLHVDALLEESSNTKRYFRSLSN